MRNIILICLGLFAGSLAIAQSSGTLDPEFGNAGRVVTSFPLGSFRVGGIVCSALRPDGRILSAIVNLHSGAPFFHQYSKLSA
jgi:hypothetical protein